MRKPDRKSIRILVGALATGLVGLIAFCTAPGEEQRPRRIAEARPIWAVMARIEAESRGSVYQPEIQAAPRTADTLPAVEESAEAREPSPPDGYSFVAYHGEMSRARIAGGGDTDDTLSRRRPDWLNPAVSIETLSAQASDAGRDWAFGWVRLAENARQNDVVRPLAEIGVAFLGSSGNLVRARLPGEPAMLQEIAAFPEVDGLGAVPPEEKLPEVFAREVREAPPREQTPVFITLMADDPDGRWRRALENLDAVVGRFDPDMRAYTANVAYGQVEAIAAADYVLAIEPVGIVRPAHDTAVPAMGADALRTYDGSPGIFSGMGGASVPIGVMDTGLNINHLDIASNRESICGANFAWNSGWFGPDGPVREAEDLWIDEYGHGTHVTGTIAGNGYVRPQFAGMAPAVRHIRFAKVLDISGSGFGDSILRGMDFLAEATGCAGDGRSSIPVKPLIVNMSLSAASRTFAGRGTGARKLDSIIWEHRQLYVVAQSNFGINGFSDYGAAKNSLSVGAALDSGDIAAFSSHGPTADGRLAPQVVATGVRVHSARGGGSRGEYAVLDGTSMSSPTVAGVAALLMDAAPEHREQPALARARIMAGAIRPDAWLDVPDSFPSTNSAGPGSLQAQYGLGKASARTSILNRDRADGWIGGGAVSELQQDQYAYQDIVVPEGASRLDLVMTWDEPPADTVASTVMNDLDLWLDRDGDCGEGPCGEHFSSSRLDNVEWVILRNPEPGTYRAKVVARRVYTAPPRAALAWTVIRGASTPNLIVETDRTLLAGDGQQEVTVTVTADEYVVAGTRLHVDCRGNGDSSACDRIRINTVQASREDGISVDLSDETDGLLLIPPGHTLRTSSTSSPIPLGASIPLGEIAAGETQEVRFSVSADGDTDSVRLYFTASAWNGRGASVSVGVGLGATRESGVAQIPPNDDFAAANLIAGEQGTRSLELLLSTPEPGEPLFTPRIGRPAGSVWYQWTASRSGVTRFEIPPRKDPADLRYDLVSVFRGDRITELEQVAADLWGVLFFADEGVSYRVRVSHFGRAAGLDLRWSQGVRPANDDFVKAVVLEGVDGAVEGTSRGATLEPGEWFGLAAGTTWYRWMAPEDGWWRFSSAGSKRVLVFEGDRIASLRLVSQFPEFDAHFRAQSGTEYRISVIDPGADSFSGPYELEWSRSSKPFDDNDDFADAEPIESSPSSLHPVDVDQYATVEPEEPVETGVRTRWWEWNAPEDGSYTWRLTDAGEVVPTFAKMRVSMFTGSSTDDLQLVAQSGPDAAPSDFVLEARRGQSYWIAVGFRSGDVTAYSQDSASGIVVWGPAPGNDRLASAETIPGTEGSVSGSNRFATLERGERGSVLGHSSLWWIYEASATGWHRFWLDDPDGPWVLTVYKEGGDGFGGLEFVRSSHPPEGADSEGVEVVFHAEDGARYTIRLGARGRDGGGEFTMRWGETEAPVWLKYAGRLADGDMDAGGTSVQLRGPSSLAFNDRGTALYIASHLGLQVFERDPRTGDLTYVEVLEDGDLEGTSLIWDSHRDQLLAYRCGVWRRFEPLDETGRELEDEGRIPVSGDPPYAVECVAGVFGDIFMDDAGSFVNAVLPGTGRFQVLALDAEGGLRHVQTLTVHGLKRAVISDGGGHVYAIEDSSLLVFQRDTNTGRLTRTAYSTSLDWSAEAIAVSSDGQYLFVFDDDGKRTRVFLLEDDPSSPRELDTLSPFWRESWPWEHWNNRCGFARVRKGVPAVDVFCMDMAFGVEWQPGSDSLVATDHVAPWQPDRFNNPVPEFGHTRSLATSPDGRHAYLDTEDEGLVIFERVGAGADPYVFPGLFSVSAGEVTVGPILSNGCIGMEDVAFDNVHYTVVSSKWQSRETPIAEWTDVSGTETAGELCAYTPRQPGEYRLVAEIRIDGEFGMYSSNTIVKK